MHVYRDFTFGARIRASSPGKGRPLGKTRRNSKGKRVSNIHHKPSGKEPVSMQAVGSRNPKQFEWAKEIREDPLESRAMAKGKEKLVESLSITLASNTNISTGIKENLHATLFFNPISTGNIDCPINANFECEEIGASRKTDKNGAEFNSALTQLGPIIVVRPNVTDIGPKEIKGKSGLAADGLVQGDSGASGP
ncbi:hypothetical protein ACOSQ2_022370 [Xanthoceras sorbifolium]